MFLPETVNDRILADGSTSFWNTRKKNERLRGPSWMGGDDHSKAPGGAGRASSHDSRPGQSIRSARIAKSWVPLPSQATWEKNLKER